MRIYSARSIIFAALAGLLACAGGGVGPSDAGDNDNTNNMVDVVGTYGLKAFTTTTSGVTTDQLEAGADLSLTLNRTTRFASLVPRMPGDRYWVAMTCTWTHGVDAAVRAECRHLRPPDAVRGNSKRLMATRRLGTFDVGLARSGDDRARLTRRDAAHDTAPGPARRDESLRHATMTR
jgi:hypothetical protein